MRKKYLPQLEVHWGILSYHPNLRYFELWEKNIYLNLRFIEVFWVRAAKQCKGSGIHLNFLGWFRPATLTSMINRSWWHRRRQRMPCDWLQYPLIDILNYSSNQPEYCTECFSFDQTIYSLWYYPTKEVQKQRDKLFVWSCQPIKHVVRQNSCLFDNFAGHCTVQQPKTSTGLTMWVW